MFFVLVMILAVIGLVSLFGGTAGAGLVALVALPILFLKLAFLMMIVGFFMRGRRGWGGGHHWKGPRHDHDFRPPFGGRSRRSRRPEEPQRTDADRFDEWHRLAHAREEVDSWVDGLPEDRPQ